MEKENNDLKDEIEKLKKDLKDMTNKYNESQLIISDYKFQIESLTEAQNKLRDNNKKSGDENDELRKRLLALENEYKVKINLLTQENGDLKNQLEHLKNEYELKIKNLNATIENLKKENEDYVNDLLKQINELKGGNQDKDIKIRNLNDEIENLKKEITKYKLIEKKYANLVETNEKLGRDIKDLERIRDNLKKEIEQMKSEYEEEINKLNDDIYLILMT